MYRFKILSLNISPFSFTETCSKIIELAKNTSPSYVCFANVHMAIEAWDNKSFSDDVNNANIVCADGMPLVKAIKIKHHKKIERVAGMDVMPEILKRCEENGLSVYFFGTTDDVLKKINDRIVVDFPRLRIAGMYSPPFGAVSPDENESNVKKIAESRANIVFVALGCPKQERWMAQNYTKIPAVMLGVGGAFPVFARMQKRAPKWIRNIGMEWFFRFTQDPKRLFKRYFYTNSKFIFLITKGLLSRS